MFGDFASAPKGKKASKTAVTPQYVGFLTAVHESGNRLEYLANSAIAHHLGMITEGASKLPTGAIRFLDLLPLKVQPVVCRRNGSYNGAAVAKWNSVAPGDLLTRPVIGPENVVAAFEAWTASLETESDD
jgi:hypothetical protein